MSYQLTDIKRAAPAAATTRKKQRYDFGFAFSLYI
jgi:hypothetical protein